MAFKKFMMTGEEVVQKTADELSAAVFMMAVEVIRMAWAEEPQLMDKVGKRAEMLVEWINKRYELKGKA